MRSKEPALVVGFIAGEQGRATGTWIRGTLRTSMGACLNICRDHHLTLPFGLDWCAMFS